MGKTAIDMAYVRAKPHKIDSAIFYTVSSNFYRKKINEKSRSQNRSFKIKIKNLKLGNTHLKVYINT
ncbi:TPA: hypothetical protein JI228_13820 [Acinetobacter baumannii]|nr:hypothetical protein [Acinetobacter baumannii]